MLSDYRLLSFQPPSAKSGAVQKTAPAIDSGRYTFRNTVKLISINSAVVDRYLGVHNLSDYKLRKVKQNLEAVIPVDLEALCFKEVPGECILL